MKQSHSQNLRGFFLKIYWVLSVQFGLDPLKMLRAIRGLPRYVRDLYQFRAGYSGSVELVPCLYDWSEESGATHNEYFWQDLLVARKVFSAKPNKHVDVGSRVDGFVSHVASFQTIEVFDIRPITAQIPGVIFSQWDAMNALDTRVEYCDSLSCLHALEHFGLGRYGDPIDPQGFVHGLRHMAKLVKVGGTFYLSVPIGAERVEFNANRVFDPHVILTRASESSLVIQSLVVIESNGQHQEFLPDNLPLPKLAAQRYALGIFVFKKRSSPSTAGSAAQAPIISSFAPRLN